VYYLSISGGSYTKPDSRYVQAGRHDMQNKKALPESSAFKSILLVLALLAVLIRNAAGSLAC
jgi:hypothetical protein